MHRSDDGGRTFNIVPDTTNKFNDYFLTLADGSILAAGASEGFYKSDDGGLTWSQHSTNNNRIISQFFQLKNGNAFVTVDNASGGYDLYQIYPNDPATMIKSNFRIDGTYVVEPQDGVVIGLNNDPSVQKVYRSNDSGITWSLITGSYDNASRLGMVGENIFFITGEDGEKFKLFKSADNGENWSEVNYTGASNIGDSIYTPRNIIAVNNDVSGESLIKSSDGDVWSDTGIACSEDANTFCAVAIFYIENEIVYAYKGTAPLVDGSPDMSSLKSEIYVSIDSGNTFQKNGEVNDGISIFR